MISTLPFSSVSTLEPQCFAGYQTAQEVVPYFETVVSLFQKFDTYNALVGAGVSESGPSSSKLSSELYSSLDHAFKR